MTVIVAIAILWGIVAAVAVMADANHGRKKSDRPG